MYAVQRSLSRVGCGWSIYGGLHVSEDFLARKSMLACDLERVKNRGVAERWRVCFEKDELGGGFERNELGLTRNLQL